MFTHDANAYGFPCQTFGRGFALQAFFFLPPLWGSNIVGGTNGDTNPNSIHPPIQMDYRRGSKLFHL